MGDLEKSDLWLQGLKRLNSVIESSGQQLVGNLCYDHLQEDYVESPPNPIFRSKRDRFRKAAKGRIRMLEVGVNGGHSAYLALTSNPTLEFHGIDICEHTYVLPAVAQLQQDFPGRVFFHRGDCLEVLPRLAEGRQQFDIFHIDGAKHTYLEDVLWCERIIAGESATIVMDDTEQEGVSWAWRICTSLGVIEPEPDFLPMSDRSKYRNQVGTLRALPSWKRLVLRAIVAGVALALRARHQARNFVRFRLSGSQPTGEPTGRG
jgi:hypothetical protein